MDFGLHKALNGQQSSVLVRRDCILITSDREAILTKMISYLDLICALQTYYQEIKWTPKRKGVRDKGYAIIMNSNGDLIITQYFPFKELFVFKTRKQAEEFMEYYKNDLINYYE